MNGSVDTTSNAVIPILSLVITALAVFVGPLFTWHLTKRQIDEARLAADKKSLLDRKLANKQIVAPMRQAWINKLRENIAKYLHAAFVNAGRTTQEQDQEHFLAVMQLQAEIELSLNLDEKDHEELLKKLVKLAEISIDDPFERDSDGWRSYWSLHAEVVAISRIVLKREWDRVKTEDAN